ncbi:hypothetical protein BT96DRAFT_1079083 [Gymnopus androsaceus JB14]|uniref:Prolyl 4-hydroxylase alpha subunit Fe(2+) 2OG dioxygenase domain-containing protein n=1 Tax=Gymnopus androsaceus JB14 TaxID=1447944 RepID=A0A6A4GQQ1_9AGAR|nr:hypothetical protein BT96DRAFT_1079083 [Gymnopus androsaceus JB14]
MVAKGFKYAEKEPDQNRASVTRSLHFGIWEKFAKKPQITWETQNQSQEVSELLQQFLSIISCEIAPAVAQLYKKFYPSEWEIQKMAWDRVSRLLTKPLQNMPYLDFHGAFFAIAVKQGCSDRDHLDWGDDLEAMTFITAVDEWEGADLQTPELGFCFPLCQGELGAGKMRKMVHSAGSITSGRRITLTFFTSELLTKHGKEWDVRRKKEATRAAKRLAKVQ